MFGGDGAGLVDGGAGQCVVSEAIDIARHAPGGLEQGFDGWGFEQGQFAAGQMQAVREILG